MSQVLHAPGPLPLIALPVLVAVLGLLVVTFAASRKARYRRRLESAYARYDRPGPAGIPCPSCWSTACTCPAA